MYCPLCDAWYTANAHASHHLHYHCHIIRVEAILLYAAVYVCAHGCSCVDARVKDLPQLLLTFLFLSFVYYLT